MNTDLLVHQSGENSNKVWSPCGKSATLTMQVLLSLASSSKSATGTIVTDSVDAKTAKFNQTLNLGWKKC